MKKIVLSVLFAGLFTFKASAAVWLVPVPELFLVLFGAGGIAAVNSDRDHADMGITKDFYYSTDRLKHIISWHKSYAKGEGLYTKVETNLLEFRNTAIDLFGADTVINQDPTLKSLVQYGDDLMEISLRDFTLKKHGHKTLGELVGNDTPNYRELAQFALTITQYCRWNRDKCIHK